MKPSISIVIPAFNEEKNLETTVQETLSVLDNRFSSYEIIIINDGSTDQTAKVASRIASSNPNIKFVNRDKNMGLGYTVRQGYELATKDFTVWNPGDGGMKKESFDSMFNMIGQSDLIVPYIANPEFRSVARRCVSKAYLTILNLLFGLHLRCYNGTVIYRTNFLKVAKTSTYGFFFFAETLIVLLKSGCTYTEVPTYHQQRKHGKSTAFTFKNISEILKTAISLAWDVRITRTRRLVLNP